VNQFEAFAPDHRASCGGDVSFELSDENEKQDHTDKFDLPMSVYFAISVMLYFWKRCFLRKRRGRADAWSNYVFGTWR